MDDSSNMEMPPTVADPDDDKDSKGKLFGMHHRRRHSTTPSDVIEGSSSSNQSGDDSLVDREYQKAISRSRLRQLEYLEGRMSQFAKFMEHRDLDRNRRKRALGEPVDDSNNNRGVAARAKRARRHTSTPDQEELVHYTESPHFITGQMRDYQVEGLNWLISLYENGINGILADEMGLGKTLQAISILGYLRNHKNIKGPHVVIVPLSTLENWKREFNRFLPGVRVLHGHCRGSKLEFRQALTSPRRDWDVVVTPYHFFVAEHHYFNQLKYQYIVLDEAQRCKNENTQLSKVLRRTKYQNLLFMTGTPINNNLHELWALLNLLLPDFFRKAEDFDEWFKVEDCIDPDHERAVRLKRILQPIMLRRIKADVELAIPPKIKTTLYIPPTREMNYWSKKVLCRDVQVMKGDGTHGKFIMRIVFPYLREVTLHPYLIPGAESEFSLFVGQDIVDVSSRMVVLDKLLTKLHKRGARVLLFSQMVIMLNILQDYLEWKGYKYHRMTGYTQQEDRQDMIDEFNSPESETFIFIITTRTGGVGINLHTANTVIFYDIDWNPQADFQAEDRAHRIGQVNQVHVIRFTVSGTVDEYLHNCSNRKQALDKAIIRKSLGDCVEFKAVEHHRKKLESVNCLDVTAVDEQLDEMFAEIDRGERNARKDTLLKQIRFRSKTSRSPSEERELESIKPPVEPEPEFDEFAGYRLRPRRTKMPILK